MKLLTAFEEENSK